MKFVFKDIVRALDFHNWAIKTGCDVTLKDNSVSWVGKNIEVSTRAIQMGGTRVYGTAKAKTA